MAEVAAAHAAAVARAIKASGTLVQVAPEDFMRILGRVESPLVVRSKGGFLMPGWHYLVSYKGLCFYTRAPDILPLPGRAEVIEAKRVWLPR